MKGKNNALIKNIVICLDGTGNQFREENSNVVKLFRTLVREPEQQVVFYDPGVGTLADSGYKNTVSKNINKLMGLVFGFGIKKNIEEAYSFLMENYEDGDRVFIFGFSRGGYTARALAGFIYQVGLLDKGLQNLIPYALLLYQHKIRFGKSESFKDTFKSLFDPKPDFGMMGKFKDTFSRKINIHFLGLWDTVQSFGWIGSPIYFPNTDKNPIVKIVRHAISVDERRTFYNPLLWEGEVYKEYDSDGVFIKGQDGKTRKFKQNIKEVWFSGVHSDVGGGYPPNESELGKVSLEWLISEAIFSDSEKKKKTLLVNEYKYNRYVLGKKTKNKSNQYPPPNPLGKIHKSLKCFWWIIQFVPRKLYNQSKGKRVCTCPRIPNYRITQIGSLVHESVFLRIEKKGDYRPPNLNPENIKPYPSIRQLKGMYKVEPKGS